MPASGTARSPSLLDRLLLRLAETRAVDGLTLAVSEGDYGEILRRVEQALLLIKRWDRRRYDRLRRDLTHIWVRILPGPWGRFSAPMRACQLDPRFVLAKAVTVPEIAATIVHEATHARIDRRGVPYSEDLRERIEAACYRQEIAFADRLPDGATLRQQLEQAATARRDLSDLAVRRRAEAGTFEALRYLGVPQWSFPFIRLLRALLSRIRRWASGLTSA